MPTTPTQGVANRFGMGTAGSSTPSEQYEIISENISLDQEMIRTHGIRGTRLRPVERLRTGRKRPGGDVIMEPTYGELRNLLPRIIGAETGSGPYTYTVSDTQPSAYDVIVDRGGTNGKEFVYASCRTARAVWRGAAGSPLSMTLSIEALTETVNAAGTATWGTISATAPFAWHDAVLTIGGTAYPVIEAEWSIDWVLDTERWVNSQTRTDLPSTDLVIAVRFVLPYSTAGGTNTTSLYNSNLTGVTGNINFTWSPSDSVNVQFSFDQMVFPAKKSPITQGKQENTFALETEVYRNGTDSPLIVTLDPTPTP